MLLLYNSYNVELFGSTFTKFWELDTTYTIYNLLLISPPDNFLFHLIDPTVTRNPRLLMI